MVGRCLAKVGLRRNTVVVPGEDPAVFARLIDLDAADTASSFVGPPSPERGGRTFGGQFLAQAIAAGYRTVGPERSIHSLHGLFLNPGDVDAPTRWEVEEIRNGRSFAARAVLGFQHDREVFRLLASFHTAEDGLDYQPEGSVELSTLPRPDEVTLNYTDFHYRHPDTVAGEWFGQDRPMDIRYINPPVGSVGDPVTEPQLMWVRLVGEIPDDRACHDAALAYLADGTLVDHVMLPHGYRWQDARLNGSSLDHAMWFHRPAKADEWLLYDQRVESTGGARGLATGRFYDLDGVLIASCSQEGLMRWSDRPDPV